MLHLEPTPLSWPDEWAGMTDDEQEAYLRTVFESLTEAEDERRADHDSDGFFAHPAYSDECVQLGHVENADDELEELGTHVTGWRDETICLPTRFGVACTKCEGDCSMRVEWTNLWDLIARAGASTPRKVTV